MDADDVMQEVLLKAYRGIGDVRAEERLEAWLYRVARTSIADHLRARQRHPLVRGDARDEGEAQPSQEDPFQEDPFREDEDAVAREVALYVAMFVPFLPSPYREAITRPAHAEGRFVRQTGGHGQFGHCVIDIAPGDYAYADETGVIFSSKALVS